MKWMLVHRNNRAARLIADRHYSRQSVGSTHFVPPGRCTVLLSEFGTAAWVTSWPFAEYVKHAWPGAWVNSLFRREREDGWSDEDRITASEMIRAAVAVTLWRWPDVPPAGIVTFVDPKKVPVVWRRGHPVYGYSYLRAGFEHVGFTAGGLWAWQMRPEAMPAPETPLLIQGSLQFPQTVTARRTA